MKYSDIEALKEQALEIVPKLEELIINTSNSTLREAYKEQLYLLASLIKSLELNVVLLRRYSEMV